jgi:hypothetical protein
MTVRTSMLQVLPAIAAVAAISMANSNERFEQAKRQSPWLVAQERAAEEWGKAVTAVKRRRARARETDEEAAESDEGEEVDGKRRRDCPSGQKPTPRRGRGGDFGGCISR